jgi:hypothetical protein
MQMRWYWDELLHGEMYILGTMRVGMDAGGRLMALRGVGQGVNDRASAAEVRGA